MPIFIVIIALAAVIGLGGYFYNNDNTTPDLVPMPVATNPTEDVTPTTAPVISDITPAETPATTPVVKTIFKDGVYSADSLYTAPGNAKHTTTVNMTIANDTVTNVSITFSGDEVDASSNYQRKFLGAYSSQVIGKKLGDVKLSRVAGASLTSNSFNAAVAKISAEAKS